MLSRFFLWLVVEALATMQTRPHLSISEVHESFGFTALWSVGAATGALVKLKGSTSAPARSIPLRARLMLQRDLALPANLSRDHEAPRS